jgi:VCBS repeat-containing protein
MLRAFDACGGNSSFAFNKSVDSDDVLVVDTHFLLGAEFKRSGPDLILLGNDGKRLVIADYFKHERAPNLVGSDGATLTGETVSLLAGPAAPGQYAQATAQVTAVAIGRADKVSGLVQVTHANGVTEPLNPGSIIYKGDVIQTGEDASLAISFGDGTTLNFFSNTRMVMNEFAYDPSSNANSGVLTLVRGSFALIAGQVATTGGLDIETPVATMGIRGTSVVLVEIEPGQRYQFWAPEHVNPDGTLGAPSNYSLTLRTAAGVIPLAQVSTGNVTILNATGVGQVPQVTVQPASALAGIDAQGIQLVQRLFQPLVESHANDLRNLPPPTQVVPLNGVSPSTPVWVSGPATVGASFVSAMVIVIVAWETVAPWRSVTEKETTIVSTHNLLMGASHVDHGETAARSATNVTFVVDGGTASSTPPAGVSLSGSALSVDPNNPVFAHLALEQHETIVVPHFVTYPHSATVSQTATITTAGTNDAPAIAAPLTATHTAGNEPFTHKVTGASDAHHGETAALSVTNVTLDIAADHVPTELPAALSVASSLPPQASNGVDIAADHVPTELPAALSVVSSLPPQASNGFVVDGGTASSTPPAGVSLSGSALSVDPTYLADGEHQTIVAPAIAAPLTATGTAGDAPFTHVHTATASFVGPGQPLGTFLPLVKISDTTGTGTGGQFAWTYTVDPDAVADFAPDETLTETFRVDISDGHGGHAFQHVTVTLVGAVQSETIVTNAVQTSVYGVDVLEESVRATAPSFYGGSSSLSYDLSTVGPNAGTVNVTDAVSAAQNASLNGTSDDDVFLFATPAGNLDTLSNWDGDALSFGDTLSFGHVDKLAQTFHATDADLHSLRFELKSALSSDNAYHDLTFAVKLIPYTDSDDIDDAQPIFASQTLTLQAHAGWTGFDVDLSNLHLAPGEYAWVLEQVNSEAVANGAAAIKGSDTIAGAGGTFSASIDSADAAWTHTWDESAGKAAFAMTVTQTAQINIQPASGSDTFVFKPADNAATTINGFTPHNSANAAEADIIDLSEFNFTSFEQDIRPLLEDAAEHHPNSIDLPNGATITLPVQVATLHASDFIVHSHPASGAS